MGGEIFAGGLSKGAGAGAVEYADSAYGELHGIVEEIGDGLQSLIGTEAADVKFGFEIELTCAVGIVDCRGCFVGTLAAGLTGAEFLEGIPCSIGGGADVWWQSDG